MKPILLHGTSMNKLEQAYANHLSLLKNVGEIMDWLHEPLKLRLAYKTFYTPDFLVIKKDGFELHETKGFMRDDAAVKLKIAAQTYPWFRFFLIKMNKTGFKITEIKTH